MNILQCSNKTLYPIEYSKDITLYVGVSNKGDISLNGFILADQPDVFYRKDKWKVEEVRSDKKALKIIDLEDYAFDQLMITADKELEQYINDHIHDYSIYSGKHSIWSNQWCLNSTPETVRRSDFYIIYHMDKGIVAIEQQYGKYVYEYNLITHKGSITHHPESENICMNMVYEHVERIKRVALKQIERGYAPRAFVEILRIHHFLQGKKSIQIILKNGEVIKMKARYDILPVHSIIDIASGDGQKTRFLLNNHYDMSPRPSTDNLNDVAYLKYGRETFEIDVDALNGPDAMCPLKVK